MDLYGPTSSEFLLFGFLVIHRTGFFLESSYARLHANDRGLVFFPLTYYSVSWFSGSGVFLERRAFRDVVEQRAYVGKGERLFFGWKWSATGAVLMNDNSWRDRQLK